MPRVLDEVADDITQLQLRELVFVKLETNREVCLERRMRGGNAEYNRNVSYGLLLKCALLATIGLVVYVLVLTVPVLVLGLLIVSLSKSEVRRKQHVLTVGGFH